MAEFCVCCGKPSTYSVLLAVNSPDERLVAIPRYYLPNQHARNPDFPRVVEETYFCAECMRAVEDAVRATILYRQAENNQLSIKAV
jgi:hypothetical protein